ncbi:hypothetical protein CL634_05410 [bacterium]|nr:hypothetical protein [bacterium]
MKKTILFTSIVILGTLGCTSTVTLGPKANESSLLGASAGEGGAKLTVPFASAEIAPSKSSKSTAQEEKQSFKKNDDI